MSVALIIMAVLGTIFGAAASCLLVYNITAYYSLKKDIRKIISKIGIEEFEENTSKFIEKSPSLIERLFDIGENLALRRYFLHKPEGLTNN